MSDCCDPISYRRFFNSKEANRRLDAYRRRGLDSMASAIVRYLSGRDIEGSDVLEVGGGVGDVQIELLKAGASSATNVELSDAYRHAAEGLAKEHGFHDVMSQRFGDFVEIVDDVPSADIVILNRVVCCYPFADRMMAAALSRTRRFIGLVYPRERFGAKLAVGIGNSWNSFRDCSFRAFVHPVSEIEGAAVEAGFGLRSQATNLIWHSVVFEANAS